MSGTKNLQLIVFISSCTPTHLDDLCNFYLDEGEVYAWGHGGQGQLGQPSMQNQRVPVVIKALSDDKVAFIACGGSSSAAVSGFYQII